LLWWPDENLLRALWGVKIFYLINFWVAKDGKLFYKNFKKLFSLNFFHPLQDIKSPLNVQNFFQIDQLYYFYTIYIFLINIFTHWANFIFLFMTVENLHFNLQFEILVLRQEEVFVYTLERDQGLKNNQFVNCTKTPLTW
jgi:hypothetical protein